MKLSRAPQVVEMFTGKFGFEKSALTPIGILEVVVTVLYLIPRSAVFGAILIAALLAGKKYEAEIVSSRGETTLLAGSYDVQPARANNPQSPVKSDKPTLYLTSDTGAAPQAFEFDKLADSGLKLYHSARSASFAMRKDPTWKPAPTDAKSISCTGPTVNAVITIDQAQGRRGSLKLTRKASADRHDPPSVTVPVTQTEGGGVPEYIYFEGSKGEQDYYVNMIKKDFERGSGEVKLFLRWAEGGQEFSIGATCAFK